MQRPFRIFRELFLNIVGLALMFFGLLTVSYPSYASTIISPIIHLLLDGFDDNGGVNGELKGQLYLGNSGQSVDLSTGYFTAHEKEGQTIIPSRDGREYLHFTDSCRRVNAFIIFDCIDLREQSGATITTIELREKVSSYAELSPDKQTIAVRWEDEANGETEPRLTLFNRNGQLLRRTNVTVQGFTWLDSDTLIYRSGFTLYRANKSNLVGTPIRTFSTAQGVPTFITASPDGSQLAFTLVTDQLLGSTFKGHVWVMNVDGSGLRQLTRNGPSAISGELEPNAIEPAWSYDGKWVLVIANQGVPLGQPGAPVSGSLFAVPADGEKVVLQDIPSSNAKLIQVRDDSIFTSRTNTTPLFGRHTPMTWVPEQTYTERNGSQLLSRAIGNIYHMQGDRRGFSSRNDNRVEVANLSTNQSSVLFEFSPDNEVNFRGSLKVSKNGQLFSYVDSADQMEYVYIFSRTGNIELQTAFPAPLSGDGESWDILSGIEFSPLNNSEVMYAFKRRQQGNESQGVLKTNWRSPTTTNTLIYNDFIYADYLSDGRIVLAHKDGGVYLSDGNSTNTQLLFSTKDPITHLAAHPSQNRLVFSLYGNTWVSELNGTNLTRVTVSSGFEGRQEWSPDGKYLLVAVTDNDSNKSIREEQAVTFIISADAENIHLDKPSNQVREVKVPSNLLTHGLAAWLF